MDVLEWHLTNQPCIDYYAPVGPSWRLTLFDWILDVLRFKLCDELAVYFLCVQIVDRYLAVRDVVVDQLQVVGAAALYLADQYEGVYQYEYATSKLKMLVGCGVGAYTEAQLVQVYRDMLLVLDYRLTKSTMYHFLYAFSTNLDVRQQAIVLYQGVLATFNHEFCLKFKPSEQAICVIRRATSHNPIVATVPDTPRNSHNLQNVTKFFMRKKYKCVGRRKASTAVGAAA